MTTPKRFAERSLMIRVPQFPPNLNKASRNWWVYHNATREYAEAVRLCAIDARNRWEIGARRKWVTLDKATIAVTFVVSEARPGPLPDAHNLLSTLKKSIDVLHARPSGKGEMATVGIGLFKDDNPECLTWGGIKCLRVGKDHIINGEKETMELLITGSVGNV